MIKVGLTGGIGSGKSLVCKVFSVLGVPVYYADFQAKRLMADNLTIKSNLIQWFGNQVYTSEGLNRKYLASVIFSDRHAMEKVNRLVHPLVWNDFLQWTADHDKKAVYVLHESALLFESAWENRFDLIVTVAAEKDLRIKRVMERDHLSFSQVLERIENQGEEADKIAKSDFVIYNNSGSVLDKIIAIDKKIKNTYG